MTMADDDELGDEWGEWCRTCERRDTCTGLCKPLADRLKNRFKSRRSAPATNFSDLGMADRVTVGNALYSDGGTLEPHKRRHSKH